MRNMWKRSNDEDPRSRGQRPQRVPPRRPTGPTGNLPMKNLALWVLLILIGLLLVVQVSEKRSTREKIAFNNFLEQVDAKNLRSVSFTGSKATGEFKVETSLDVDGRVVPVRYFEVPLSGETNNLAKEIYDKDHSVKIEYQTGGTNWTSILLNWVPVLFLMGLWIFFFRQMQSGGANAMKFGKSRAKLLIENHPKVTFKDVAGCDEAKVELEEIIEFLKEPQKFQKLGGRIPRGALLLGPPGTGKTLLAKAVAGEAGVPFFSMSGSDFVEMFVGVGASVTGDTPVLVRRGGKTELVPISSFVDAFYADGEADRVIPVSGVQTLGFREKESKFKGSPRKFVGGSAWANVKGVYRHRATEICEIHYLGGVIRTTPEHSVFVRTRNGIKAVAAGELQPGDVLVNLPLKVRGEYSRELGTPHSVRSHEFTANAMPQSLQLIPAIERVNAQYAFAVEQAGQMSQAAIGSAIGVSQMTVSNWQRGRHEPRESSSNYTDRELPESVEISKDLLRLMGYYTAEGRANGSLEFTFGAHETDLHADCIAVGERLFGIKASVQPTQDNSTRILFYSAPLGRFFERHCGTGSRNKHVPEFMWDLPREMFEAYLTGYALGDGYTTSEGKLSMTSVSRRLIQELTWLCAMQGIKAGVRRVIMPAGRVIKSKPLPETEAWNLIIGKTSDPFAQDVEFRDQGKKPVVRKVERLPYDGYVYDLCGCDNEAFFGGEKPLLLHNSRVRDLFDQGKKNAPCIIFIDEIDAVGRHRGAGMGGGHDEREQTLNQLLVEMDGFDSNEAVILLAATNRPDVLDPALTRPGRFDRQIVVDWPDSRGREGILKVHVRNIPMDSSVKLDIIAKSTPGMSGADLANLVNEAALLAARRNKKKVTMRDFEDAKDKVILGTERKSLVMSEEERLITAYHEAGHALVSWLIPEATPVHKVTVIPRGRALGVTSYIPKEERHNRSKDQLMAYIATSMGGRAAEKIIYNQLTTGAAGDIEQATNLARKMVCSWGMSEKLGSLAFGKRDDMVFLGREMTSGKDYSEHTAELIDEEVRGIVDGGYQRAFGLLKANEDKLHLLAKTLMEREVLDGEEMDRVLKGEILEPRPGDNDESPPAGQTADSPQPQPVKGPSLGQGPKQLDAFA